MEVELNFDKDKDQLYEETCEVHSMIEWTRQEMHCTPSWSLPPLLHLSDHNDMDLIKPIWVALAADSSILEGVIIQENALATQLLGVSSSIGFVAAARSFIALKADVNAHDARTQFTPLMHAVQGSCVELIQLLLDNGADPSVEHPKLGSTAVHMALALPTAQQRSACAMPLLRAHAVKGIPLTTDRLGCTALGVLLGCPTECNGNEVELVRSESTEKTIDVLAADGCAEEHRLTTLPHTDCEFYMLTAISHLLTARL